MAKVSSATEEQQYTLCTCLFSITIACKCIVWAEETAQQFRVLAALPENKRLVPSTHT